MVIYIDMICQKDIYERGSIMIDYVVIGMVLHVPLTGYDIKKLIEMGTGNFVKASHGSLYPALKKLADKDFLTMREQPQGDRMKKYYQATELGKAAFLEWLTSPLDSNSFEANLLARIYFFEELPENIRIQQLQEYELNIQQILRGYKKLERQLSTSTADEVGYYEISTLYYGLQSAQGMIRWLKYIAEQKPLSKFIREGDEGES